MPFVQVVWNRTKDNIRFYTGRTAIMNNNAAAFVSAREINEIVGTSERICMSSAFIIGVLRHHLAAVLLHN